MKNKQVDPVGHWIDWCQYWYPSKTAEPPQNQDGACRSETEGLTGLKEEVLLTTDFNKLKKSLPLKSNKLNNKAI
jgi:hypothetical protein